MLELIRELGLALRERVHPLLGAHAQRAHSGAGESGDVTFAIDAAAEDLLERFVAERAPGVAFYSEDRGLVGADDILNIAGKKSVHLFVHSIANASLGRFVSGESDQLVPRQFQKTFESMAHSFVYWTQEMVARDLLAPGARLLGLTMRDVDGKVLEEILASGSD